MSIRHCVVILAAGLVFLAGLVPVRAADVAPNVEPAYYTYFSFEGGYVHLDGEEVQAFYTSPDRENFTEQSLDVSDGIYGRAELGRVWDDGMFNGLGVYIQGWKGDEDATETDFFASLAHKHNGVTNIRGEACEFNNEPCAVGQSTLDRSLFEAGLRFFHEFRDAMELDGISLGIEPFVALINEDSDSLVGSNTPDSFRAGATRSSNLDATAYGALLALDARYHFLERTALTVRAAAGAYYMDADADTHFHFASGGLPPASNSLSSDYVGFRGQLALGVEQDLTEASSFGLVGRLDYWSDYPSMEWTNSTDFNDTSASDNSIAKEDFLALSIGARLSFRFGP